MRKIPKPLRKRIVEQVIKEHGIKDRERFFSRDRTSKMVAARKDAILRLMQDGAYATEAARLVNRSLSSVLYHASPEVQARKKAYLQRWWSQRTRNRKRS